MDFEVIGELTEIEAIAIRNRIRVLRDLQKRQGKARWRKLKGISLVRLVEDGSVRKAERADSAVAVIDGNGCFRISGARFSHAPRGSPPARRSLRGPSAARRSA